MNVHPTVATVESKPDPHQPGRTEHYISGATAAIVQDAIDTISRTVDAAFGGALGQAHFVGPIRHDGAWRAAGVVLIETEAVQ